MRLLLDTHAFLWFIGGDPQLSATARQLIADAANEKWFSMASVWEMAIKISIGKLTPLDLTKPFEVHLVDQWQRNGVTLLPITLPHVAQVATLPFHHRDPFDRLLAAQSLVEATPLVSADVIFDSYGVQRLW